MSLPDRLVIELGKHYQPFVFVGTASEREPVPVRLREYQENLTQLYVGHEVTDFEWVETGETREGPTGSSTQRLLVAWHDKERCRRCARVTEAERRDSLLDPALDEAWEAAADRVQAFYREFIPAWDEHPEALDPRLDNPLRRQRLHVRKIGVDRLHQWLEAATRYVHARMHQTWIEEDVFAKTRSQLNAMRAWGTFDISEADAERVPTFVADGTGREHAGYAEAPPRAHARLDCAMEAGKRLATPREVGIDGCEQAIAHRTEDLRTELPQLRTRLVAVTRQLRGA